MTEAMTSPQAVTFDDEVLRISELPPAEIANNFEIIPVSIFDARALAHFDCELAELDARIEEMTGHEDQSKKSLSHKMSERSCLFADRLVYEIELAGLRDTMTGSDEDYLGSNAVDGVREASWGTLAAEITEYPDKLRVLRTLLATHSFGVLAAIPGFYDLRAEAERAQDVTMLAQYLCEEIRAGYNLHTNFDHLVSTLIPHKKCEIRISELEDALLSLQYDRLTVDDVEGAEHAQKLLRQITSMELSAPADKILVVKLNNLNIKKVTKPRGLTKKDKQYEHNQQLTYTNLKPKYSSSMLSPGYGNSENDPMVLATLDPNYENGNRLTRATVSLASPAELRYMARYLPDSLRNAKLAIFDNLLENYQKTLSGEAVDASYRVDNSVNGIFKVTAELSLLATELGQVDSCEELVGELESRLEVILVDYTTRRKNPVINDMLDDLSGRVPYNRTIESIFFDATNLPSLIHRFRAMAKVASFQAIHDPSSPDSSLQEQYAALESVAELLRKSPGDSLLLYPNEIDESLMRIIELARNANSDTVEA